MWICHNKPQQTGSKHELYAWFFGCSESWHIDMPLTYLTRISKYNFLWHFLKMQLSHCHMNKMTDNLQATFSWIKLVFNENHFTLIQFQSCGGNCLLFKISLPGKILKYHRFSTHICAYISVCITIFHIRYIYLNIMSNKCFLNQ